MTDQPQTLPESKYTQWGGTFTCYNGKAAEVEFIEFVAAFARVLRPRRVIETGAGKGFTTRAVVKACPTDCVYVAVESEPRFHSHLTELDPRIEILTETPDMTRADLVILDSNTTLRLQEIERFDAEAKAGAVCIIHDASRRHKAGTIHRSIYERCRQLKKPHRFLNNPRGGCLVFA